jgi:glycosyltransferase involved in cell wall biosynthesis
MNLLELCLSPGFGGLELYAFKVISHYQNRGSVCVAVVRPGTLLDRKLDQSGLQRVYLQPRLRYLPLIAARQLAKLLDKHEIDTLHIHWRGDLPLAVLAKRFARGPIRLVYTRQMALTRGKFDFYHRFLYKNVDLYLTITKRLQSDARRLLPISPDKVQLLYYGVPSPGPVDEAGCVELFTESNIQKRDLTVGLFGRIEYGKGQHLLVAATQRLCEQGYDVQAVLVGHIMDQDYFDGIMQDVKTKGLKDRVVYLGFHENPPAIMGCFDAVVLASKDETFGLVLAEAMRAGTAVIGSNAGGVPEIIDDGETGFLFESENAADLTRCMEKLVTDPNTRTKLARQGKAYADETFSEERHFQELTDFFDSPTTR